MQSIWKWELNTHTDIQTFKLHKGAIFLALMVDISAPIAFFQIDTNQGKEERCFRFIKTGAHVPSSCRYLASAHIDYKTMLHLYEEDKVGTAAAVNVIEFTKGVA